MKRIASLVLFVTAALAIATVATPTPKIEAAPVVKQQCCDIPPPPPDCPPNCSSTR